jgi:hypothetical protein
MLPILPVIKQIQRFYQTKPNYFELNGPFETSFFQSYSTIHPKTLHFTKSLDLMQIMKMKHKEDGDKGLGVRH